MTFFDFSLVGFMKAFVSWSLANMDATFGLKFCRLFFFPKIYYKNILTKFREIAKFEESTENEISRYYKDEDTFRLVSAMGSVIGILLYYK